MGKVNIIFTEKPEALAEALEGLPSVFVVADRKVRRNIAEPLVELCAERGVAVRGMLCIRTSEKRKNLRTVEKIITWLTGAGADRDSTILGIGGGITLDLAGLAACLFKRGIAYANVPTTLLAQVDAGIGGKTGCNAGGWKNMAGRIQQPLFTYVNTQYVKSLPWKEFSAGYAEMLKTFIIGDAACYEDAVRLEDYGRIGPLIGAALQIKKEIVERDETEQGERRVLNLGHSWAHAIEYLSGHSLLHRGIPHGHAVAMGMILAARRSEELGIARRGLADRLEEDFEAVGLPVRCPFSEERLQKVMYTDKKTRGGKLHLVLIKDIGKVTIQ